MAAMFGVLIALLSMLYCVESSPERVLVPAERLKAAPYAEWAHHHWVWLSADRANQSSMIQYAQEYLDHGIKVGAVDIDSGWSTGYNNFEFDTHKYPNATEMIANFHSKSIRVLLWATSMINTDSSNYKEAHDNGYMIKDVLGKQALFSWWHGKGGLLDYTNPKAVQWWHSQMDKVLSLDIDGWKCDGTDPYIMELVFPESHSGFIGRRKYSHDYYGDFFNYTRQKLGNDRLIMSRPADGFGPIYLDYSPHYVMYSGWVGDDDPTFKGLQNALKSYLQSAWAGYANFGSDIGGYREGTGPLGRDKILFLRWAGVGAFSPLMENGGNMEHRPWAFDKNNDTLHAYNRFVTAHYELVPYLLTTGTEAFERQKSSIKPMARHEGFINKIIDNFKPSTLNYMLGANMLVAPVSENDTTYFNVPLPEEHTWMYWWDHSKIYLGGNTVDIVGVPLDEIPVFVINGTFLPLRVDERSLMLTDNRSYKYPVPPTLFTGYLRWFMHSPVPREAKIQSTMREEQAGGMAVTHWWPSPDHLVVTVSAHKTESSLVEIAGLSRPVQAVRLQGVQESMLVVPPAKDVIELESHSKWSVGYVQEQEGQHWSVLIHPGYDGTRGHYIHVHF